MDTPGKPSVPTTPGPTTSEATDGKSATTERTRRKSSELGIGSIAVAAWSLTLAKGLGVVFGLGLVVAVLWSMVGGIVSGVPVVTSGRSLQIDGVVVELWGVQAPRFSQTCTSNGKRWACGAYSFAALYEATRRRSVWCVKKASAEDRIIAQCYVGLSDVAKSLVQNGWAEADSRATTKYANAERAARQARKGLWLDGVSALPERS